MRVEEIVNLCRENDRSAQHKLFEQYNDALYTIGYRIIGDFTRTDDVLQESFIQIFKSIHQLKEPKYFYSWAKTILIRKSYLELKKSNKMKLVDELQDKHDFTSDPSFDIDYIEKAIQRLPKKCKAVFVLAEIEGYKHKEIAELLEISEGTSKSQLSYAKTKLKTMLEPYVQ